MANVQYYYVRDESNKKCKEEEIVDAEGMEQIMISRGSDQTKKIDMKRMKKVVYNRIL